MSILIWWCIGSVAVVGFNYCCSVVSRNHQDDVY